MCADDPPARTVSAVSPTSPPSRSEPPAGWWWAATFFVLLAVTPVIPYIPVPGLGLAYNDLPPIMAIGFGLLAAAAKYRRRVVLRVSPVVVMTILIALIAAASTVSHGLDPADALSGPIRWTETSLVIGLAFLLGDDRRLWSLLLRLATLIAAADALFGIVAFVLGLSLPNYIGIEPFRDYQTLHAVFPGRISGTLGLPSNGAGALFALVLPVALGYAIGATDRQARLRWFGVTMTLTVALMFTFDRISILAALVLVVALLGLRLRPQVAVLVGVCSVLVIAASPLRQRFTSDGNDRLALWTAALKMIRANPLFGVGPAQYANALPLFRNTQFGIASTTAHNSLLEAAATMGLFAGLLLTAAIVGSLVWLPAAMRHRVHHPELLGAWLGLAGFFLSALTVNFFFWPQLGLLYWTMAMALSRSTEMTSTGDADLPAPPAALLPRQLSVVERRAVMAGRAAP